MKGDVITQFGASADGKYTAAVFVMDLDSVQEAVELMPFLNDLVRSAVKKRIRHGLHIVDENDNEPPEN